MDVLELSDDANSDQTDHTTAAGTNSPPSSWNYKSALRKAAANYNKRGRGQVRFCPLPILKEHAVACESPPDSSATHAESITSSRSPTLLPLSRSADGIASASGAASKIRQPIGIDGWQDCTSVGGPSSPGRWTNTQCSSSTETDSYASNYDAGSSPEIFSPTSGGRHIQTRELAPTERTGDVELRREVSEFIRHAKRGNPISGKKKTDELAIESPKEPSMSEVTGSFQEIAASTWNRIVKGWRTFVGTVFRRHRRDSHFKTADFRSMWVNPLYANDFDVTPGTLQMRFKIGSGSYGVVYLVEHKKTWAKYAVKCVRKQRGKKQASFLKRSETEFHVWREIGGHPNIMSLIAAFQTRSAFCFVMDFVATGSLSLLLSRQDKPLREEEIRRMASQLAHALYTVHRLGFLHRDVSCSNVLVTSKRNILLIDFGSSVIGHTATTRAGTLAYMAPEVLAGRTSGPGADWWSYGIVLFALFEGTTPMHIYANRCKIDLRKLSLRSRFSVMKRVSVPISPLLHLDKRNLLKDFLREDPKFRLGVRRKQDFNLVKQHAYFGSVNWGPMDEALDRILRRKYNLPNEDEAGQEPQ